MRDAGHVHAGQGHRDRDKRGHGFPRIQFIACGQHIGERSAPEPGEDQGDLIGVS